MCIEHTFLVDCGWPQETRLYTLCNEKSNVRPIYQVQPRENWWSA